MDDLTSAQRVCANNTTYLLKLVAASTKYFNTNFADLPEDVQKECERLEKLIGHDWVQFGICLGIPKPTIEDRRGSNNQESFWNVIQFRKTIDPLKVQDLHLAFANIKKPGWEKATDLRRMSDIHMNVVNAFKRELYTEVVDAVIVLPYIRCFIYISPEVVQFVLLPEATITRMANLIDVLSTFGSQALQVFSDALFHSGHEALSSNLREMAEQKGDPITYYPVPIPLDERDRLYLRRRSSLIESPRVADDVNEIRNILLEKAKKHIAERESETALSDEEEERTRL